MTHVDTSLPVLVDLKVDVAIYKGEGQVIGATGIGTHVAES
jgi:hypothetical protein